jgi:epoxyqueuosine reductase
LVYTMNAPGGSEAPADRADRAVLAKPIPGDLVELHDPGPAPFASQRSPAELAREIRDAAVHLGFARVGFTPVAPFERGGRALETWLANGHHGEMSYLSRGPDRSDPTQLFAGACTLIVVALPYDRLLPVEQLNRKSPLLANVARYAHGRDYHAVLKFKLRQLADRCATVAARPVLARPCVDSAPLLEREAAARAGLGFIAKSTMTIVPGVGTRVVLGELLVDLAIAPDAPIEPRCGTCSACLDACPTGAFVDAFVLDARRCISYLTIELKGAIPRELRALMSNHVFGCDICQLVCPFNASRHSQPSAPELAPRPELGSLTLLDLLELSSSGYRRLVRDSAMRRVSRTQLARNAAVALGNSGDQAVVPRLVRALEHDRRGLVREHVAWALGRLGGSEARAALERATKDDDPAVAEEARIALESSRP